MLDQPTVERIRLLALRWGISEAEVIRRVVAETETAESRDPNQLLDALHASGGGLSAQDAAAYLNDVREDRKL
jgi:hypothetical protein